MFLKFDDSEFYTPKIPLIIDRFIIIFTVLGEIFGLRANQIEYSRFVLIMRALEALTPAGMIRGRGYDHQEIGF